MPGVEKRSLERLPLLVHLLDEVEEHDHVADDDADQAGDAEEGHEAEGCVHDRQRNKRADDTVGSRGKDEEWLDGVVELDEKREDRCRPAKSGARQPD